MNQTLPLFDGLSSVTTVLNEQDALIELHHGFLPTVLADQLLDNLQRELKWSRHMVKMFGRELPSPRLSAWHGDPEARYRYSNVEHDPQPWTASLQACRERLDALLPGAGFNSVLANWYRDGQDCMGWHADDEQELGRNPLIASLSLGAEREFLLRSMRPPGRRLALRLPHGSLLLMSGSTQHRWQHALPRRARCADARINLTFRKITHPMSAQRC